jgi:DNA-directed RNA polymerase specialized sigma24 family protein
VFGVDDGRDASAQALLFGWENWERVRSMANPAGYLLRVGQTWGRRNGRQPMALSTVAERHDPWVEPRLPAALELLPEQQSVAVVLRHGADWSYTHIADFLEISPTSVRKNVERALARLRVALEVSDEA